MRRSAAAETVDGTAAAGARGATRDLILDVAERLFAEHGIAGVSLRAIIAEAGVNTAAVHYHFGSKENLVAEVFLHRAALIADERLRLLGLATRKPPGRERLEAILHAFLEPGLLGGADSVEVARRYAKFRAKLVADQSDFARDLLARSFNESSRRFVEALADTLPGFDREELLWRMHGMIGMMVYTMSDTGRIASISQGACDPSDYAAALDRILPIAVDVFAPGLPGAGEACAGPENSKKRTNEKEASR